MDEVVGNLHAEKSHECNGDRAVNEDFDFCLSERIDSTIHDPRGNVKVETCDAGNPVDGVLGCDPDTKYVEGA